MSRIRSQKATQDLVAQAETAVAQAKGAVTSARKAALEVERSAVPAAPPGTYYHYELLGCRCFDGGRELGEVVDLAEDGGGLLLIVADGERSAGRVVGRDE